MPNNGVYRARLARICKVLGHRLTTIDYSGAAGQPRRRGPRAGRRPSITHVALVHCETGAGVLNPLHEVAQVVVPASAG